MTATDELRDCIRTANRSYEDVRNPYNDREILHIPEGELLKIADRIDKCHERAMRQSYDEGFASADDWLAQHEDAMAEHGWIRLPVDADGVPIRIGERVQLIGNYPSTVSHMSLAYDGWRVYVKYDGGNGTWSGEPRRISHHHAPTVEDVLTEFGIDWEYESDCEDRAALLKEYAARLRLAEEVDE